MWTLWERKHAGFTCSCGNSLCFQGQGLNCPSSLNRHSFSPPPPLLAPILPTPLSLPRPSTCQPNKEKKKIDGFSIYRLPGHITTRESQFTGDGWLIRTLIWKNLYKTHYSVTCHLTRWGGERCWHKLIYVWLGRCQLFSLCMSISLPNVRRRWGELQFAFSATFNPCRNRSELTAANPDFLELFTSHRRQHSLSFIDQLINLSSLLSAHPPWRSWSHLLTSLGG